MISVRTFAVDPTGSSRSTPDPRSDEGARRSPAGSWSCRRRWCRGARPSRRLRSRGRSRTGPRSVRRRRSRPQAEARAPLLVRPRGTTPGPGRPRRHDRAGPRRSRCRGPARRSIPRPRAEASCRARSGGSSIPMLGGCAEERAERLHLFLRDTGRGLVEKENARSKRERCGQLEEAEGPVREMLRCASRQRLRSTSSRIASAAPPRSSRRALATADAASPRARRRTDAGAGPRAGSRKPSGRGTTGPAGTCGPSPQRPARTATGR